MMLIHKVPTWVLETKASPSRNAPVGVLADVKVSSALPAPRGWPAGPNTICPVPGFVLVSSQNPQPFILLGLTTTYPFCAAAVGAAARTVATSAAPSANSLL